MEAQRLGLPAHASDLNPVAVLITKALIEIPATFADQPPVNPADRHRLLDGAWKGTGGIAADISYYGKLVRDEAERRIGDLYPKVLLPAEYGGREAMVNAWLWARTVTCPNPACGAKSPLVRSFVVSARIGRKIWIHPVVDRQAKTVHFRIRSGEGSAPVGTVNRRGGVCLFCASPIPFDHIRSEGRAGQLGTQMMAIATESRAGRVYVAPTTDQQEVASKARADDAPDTELPNQALGFRVQLYGMTRHRDLFTPRQLLALTTLSNLIREARESIRQDALVAGMNDDGVPLQEGGRGVTAYADAVTTYLAFALDKYAMYGCALVPWYAKEDRPSMLFGRQAISMVWDFAEINPFADIGGSFGRSAPLVADSISSIPTDLHGSAAQMDAARDRVNRMSLVSTDPPYYDNVPYADLSDFFYIWLRRSIGAVYPDLFNTVLVPKAQELVADPHRYGDRASAESHFLAGMRRAFALIRESAHPEYPVTVYYAFKQSESDDEMVDGDATASTLASTGWEVMLDGLLKAGFAVNGTWPMRTERSGRLRDTGSNALASSIVLVCRPRPASAAFTTRRDFTRMLKRELPDAIRALQRGNIAPVDLAQAAIGPGMAVFSRYSRVLEADGTTMSVRSALALINQSLDEVLAERESEYDAGTRWALAWFEQFCFTEGPYGVAETLSKAKNTSVGGLVEAGILAAKAGKVRLLLRDELSADWDPATDRRITVWEVTQQFIRALETGGDHAAASLLRKVGDLGEVARDLAYRLYGTCERKKWAQEALAYNGLVTAWPEIARLAAQQAEPAASRLL